MRTPSKSALLKTSAVTDIKRSGGVVNITGLADFRDKDVLSMKQIIYRAEVSQVIATGGGSYAPTGATKYTIQLTNPAYGREGSVLSTDKKYSYPTPVDITELGATAALQREAIHVALVAKINADARNYVAALTLGTGTGFSITDDAGYFGARNGGSYGRSATIVKAIKNTDGTGWVDSIVTSTTTAAVYGFGVGSRMDDDAPVIAAYLGAGLISGEIDSPVAADGTFAISGQQYDAFGIQCLKPSTIPTINSVIGNCIWEQVVFVDNGKGTATTNAAGFLLFERAAQKIIFDCYENDVNSVIEYFDKSIIVQGPIGVSPVGTTATNNSIAVYNDFISPYGALELRNVGTQTILGPTRATGGLLTDQDVATGEGSHYSPSLVAINRQEFVVGKQSFSVIMNRAEGIITGDNFQVGFHEKLYFTDFNDYVTLASVGTLSTAGEITTRGILASAATVITSSATVIVAATVHEFRVHVAIDGTVSCYVDNVKYPIYSVSTTALVLAAGTVVVPFFQSTQITGTAGAGLVSKFVAIADAYWKI